jgi:Uncharacterized protein conserved in bacteria (DUF2062)
MQILLNLRRKAAVYLRQGITPRRLALTLVLGFVIGCIPMVGLPTALCAVIALTFRLNQPAIQAANYVAMPFQLGLLVPLVRLGGKLFPIAGQRAIDVSGAAHSPAQFIAQAGGMAGQAFFAWLLLAIPVVLLLTPALTLILRRVPAVAAVESVN